MNSAEDNSNDYGSPQVIIVLSGKRKSGKDYIADLLFERFGSNDSVIIRLSGPLKERYAKENNLEYSKLLDASDYKEIYRLKMIHWGEAIRLKDPGYFCHHAILQTNAKTKKFWIISDARRKSDIEFFNTKFPHVTHTVRVNASPDVRKARGWIFTKGVDDCESECGLDDFSNWKFELVNNTNQQILDGINTVLAVIKPKV